MGVGPAAREPVDNGAAADASRPAHAIGVRSGCAGPASHAGRATPRDQARFFSLTDHGNYFKKMAEALEVCQNLFLGDPAGDAPSPREWQRRPSPEVAPGSREPSGCPWTRSCGCRHGMMVKSCAGEHGEIDLKRDEPEACKTHGRNLPLRRAVPATGARHELRERRGVGGGFVVTAANG